MNSTDHIKFTDIQRTKCTPYLPARKYENLHDTYNPFAVYTDENSRFIVNKFDTEPIKPEMIQELPKISKPVKKNQIAKTVAIVFIVFVVLVTLMLSMKETQIVKSLLSNLVNLV
jgi:hypothetical protein